MAQSYNQQCLLGVNFEISTNPCWGYGEPVVLSVDPGSPADKANIKPGDIIMEVNKTATYLRNYQTIASWLTDNTSQDVSFTIRNLNTYFKEYQLSRKCISKKAIGEADLAELFAFYSLENTQERAFTIPLKVITNKNTDYSDYHTFDIMKDPNVPSQDIDNYINSQIEKALTDKGLTRKTDNPDFVVQTFYSYQPNLKYNPANSQSTVKQSWRYDSQNKKMVLLPILPGDYPSAEREGQFLLELGVRFLDNKHIDENNYTQIWEATATEYVTSQYTLGEYAQIHLPLIMMQFPHKTDKTQAKYIVDFKRYYYTGIYYNMDDMKTITDVDPDSPAYIAGLRSGMVVDKINDQKFNFTKDELTNGYKRFITETMKYRDAKTRFTDANGFKDCMYWDKKKYNDIRNIFIKSNKIYMPVFSYLYGFESYIAADNARSISLETRIKTYSIIPEMHSSVSIIAL